MDGTHLDLRFADVLRSYRTTARLSQRELADRAGLSVGAVRDLEQGRRRTPRRSTVRRLGAALGLPAPSAAGPDPARRFVLRVLGPLELRVGGRAVRLGPPRQRAVLGLLALCPNALVHREEIIDRLWARAAPATAVHLVQAYVSRLRALLLPDAPPERRRAVLESTGASYRLRVRPDGLDLLRFGRLTEQARTAVAAGNHLLAGERYEAALRLWRGTPLADVDLLRGSAPVATLAEQRVATAIRYAEAAARTGRHHPVPQLRLLADADPLHEALHARLMLALAAGGQQAAALRVYAEISARLADQLGLTPGPELTDARLQVLRGAADPRPGPG
ncbi:BTAD domain-containing putative transcriptional regulator [Actinocatenispora sera]|uniref:BTAD domain-containing putative transcriptional regulator n=1 Tax=Actinocatenispora sera TaxID=390989 RepID=UPI0033EF6865